MKLLIVHLSDLHLTTQPNPLLRNLDKIGSAVKAEAASADACLLAVTGDIAYSAKTVEYEVAAKFIDSIAAAVETVGSLVASKWVLVPGNHDCDFEQETQARQALLTELSSKLSVISTSDTSIADLCTQVQDEFFRFLAGRHKGEVKRGNDRLFWVESFDIGAKTIRLECYNTAWVSSLKEKQGGLLYPPGLLTDSEHKADLVVSLFHHPYNWLEASNSRVFRKHVESISDIVLTGHEHEPGIYEKRSIGDEGAYFIEGAVLHDRRPHVSGFNLVTVDLDAAIWKATQYQWSADQHLYTPSLKTDWRAFTRSRRILQHEFQNTREFTAFLSDPGTTFTHPRARQLSLRDIFVYPDLEELSIEKAEKEIVPGERLRSYFFENQRVLVAGAERSGKTTLAKVLFADLLDQGIVPVLLTGEKLRNPSEEQVLRSIEREFTAQYSSSLWEKYRQLDRGSRALVIDDFQRTGLNPEGRRRLMDAFDKHFDRVYILADDLFEIEELSQPQQEGALILSFHNCKMRELGNLRREELIKHWHSIGQEYTADEEEIAYKIEQTERTVNTLLGKNLLPSYPLFVLTILQLMETQISLKTVPGSYGYIYEALITMSLARTSDSTTLDTKFTYLAHFAYRMFKARKAVFDAAELEQVTSEYFNRYKVPFNTTDMMNDLQKAFIVSQHHRGCGFKYKYLYYYFVAKYIQENVNSSTEGSVLRSELGQLTKRLHTEEAANILIFFVYLTKDPQVIQGILVNARAIFADEQPCDLDADVRFVMSQESIPKFAYDAEKKRTARAKYLRTWDEVEEIAKRDEQRQADELEREDPDLQLSTSAILNMAAKTSQVMGQILRNFPGSLRGELKREIALESYLLGLRVLKVLLSSFQADLDQIKNRIKEHLEKEKRLTDKSRVSSIVDSVCLIFALALCYAVIKTISHSVGSAYLRETYRELIEGESRAAFYLVDMSVKLDHFRPTPEDEIVSLHRRLKDNLFAQSLLKGMVTEHVYLFPVKYRTIQRLCSKLQIQVKMPKALGTKMKK